MSDTQKSERYSLLPEGINTDDIAELFAGEYPIFPSIEEAVAGRSDIGKSVTLQVIKFTFETTDQIVEADNHGGQAA